MDARDASAPGVTRTRPSTAFPLGMAFAIGWSPCIGPVLTGILAVAASTSSVVAGTSLLLAYSLGLALPFLALAAGAGTPAVIVMLRRHGRGFETGGGLLLIGIGALMLTGVWQWLFAPLQRALSGTDGRLCEPRRRSSSDGPSSAGSSGPWRGGQQVIA